MTDTTDEERGEKSVGGSAALVAVATMCSRVLGLVREQVFAAIFGAGALATAIKVGFLLPNLLRDMLGEGVLTAAYVPTFADVLKKRGIADAFRLANIVLGLVLVGVGAIVLLGIVFAPELVALFTEYSQNYRELAVEHTIEVTQILFPFLLFMSMGAVVMGTLNAQERYWIPAIAPAMHNLVAISGGIYLLVEGIRDVEAMRIWAVALLFAGFTQLAFQLPELWRSGFRLRPCFAWRDPAVLRIGRLMAPATVGLAALQVNLLVRTWFATQQDGAIPWLDYGFRLFYLPLGVFGVAVATICTTKLALRAVEGDMDGMRRTYATGLKLVAFLSLPSTVGLIVLREPIVALIFERGMFTPSDTHQTAWAVALFSLGLYAYSAVKVTAPAFYALNRTRIPVIASVSAVAANLVISVALFPVIGFKGLALGMSVAAAVNFVVLFFAFQAMTGGVDIRRLIAHGLRVVLATIPCGVTGWWVEIVLSEQVFGDGGTLPRAAAVGSAILASAVIYAGACRVLRVPELDTMLAFTRRTLRR